MKSSYNTLKFLDKTVQMNKLSLNQTSEHYIFWWTCTMQPEIIMFFPYNTII